MPRHTIQTIIADLEQIQVAWRQSSIKDTGVTKKTFARLLKELRPWRELDDETWRQLPAEQQESLSRSFGFGQDIALALLRFFPALTSAAAVPAAQRKSPEQLVITAERILALLKLFPHQGGIDTGAPCAANWIEFSHPELVTELESRPTSEAAQDSWQWRIEKLADNLNDDIERAIDAIKDEFGPYSRQYAVASGVPHEELKRARRRAAAAKRRSEKNATTDCSLLF